MQNRKLAVTGLQARRGIVKLEKKRLPKEVLLYTLVKSPPPPCARGLRAILPSGTAGGGRALRFGRAGRGHPAAGGPGCAALPANAPAPRASNRKACQQSGFSKLCFCVYPFIYGCGTWREKVIFSSVFRFFGVIFSDTERTHFESDIQHPVKSIRYSRRNHSE